MSHVADRTQHTVSGARRVRVHAIQTGRLTGNESFMRSEGWSSLLLRRTALDFPVYCYVVEHPEGLIAIDTGMNARARVPLTQRRFVPRPLIRPDEEIGPQMRAAGLRPEDVRRVVITHLDWDHVGGVAHFPDAEILVHRPEHEFASTFMGRLRYQTGRWSPSFAPTLYDLDGEPHGPFPESRPITDSGDVRVVPIPGHSVAQVAVIVQADGVALMFAADHVLRQDWFVEDYRAGRLKGLGAQFFPEQAVETSRRIHRYAQEVPTVLLPAHDAEAPARLAAMQTLEL